MSYRSQRTKSDAGSSDGEEVNNIRRVRQPALPPPRQIKKSNNRQPPQQIIDDFWSTFNSRTPGRISTVLPNDYYAKRVTQRPDADEGSHNAYESYAEAARICTEKVEKIVKECRRVNQKYRDPHFDLEKDFIRAKGLDCLNGLVTKPNESVLAPKSVKRIGEIFENPQFFIAGATANDVRQGGGGDCWLMSALSTISNCSGLIEKICVARDEKVGVYGFVFHRDGAWVSEVVDDKLYLIKEDFYDHDGAIDNWLEIQNPKDIEREYRKRFQTGSKALYFAQCSDPNETWLPLLEKAYAKAHGDYRAVEGGFVGEAIEDMTGGVTSEVHGTDILDRDAFWNDELLQVNKLFLFGCGQGQGTSDDRKGIQHRHAYSIMEAREVDGKRLLKLRNPWGNTEWQGPWSDGSEEWTPYWMEKLDHRFGNDGVFWILYDDLLNVYQHFDRTRLLNEDWRATQQWVSLNVPWSIDYHDTHFKVEIKKAGPVVVVLSQLDDRYYRGLEGQYTFRLQFRLHKEGELDYLVRSPSSYNMRRSVSTEVDLEPGVYVVMVKIIAHYQVTYMPTEEVVKAASRNRREKLLAIGLSHDLAHAKGQVKEHEREEREREMQRRRAKRKDNAKAAFEATRKANMKAKSVARRRAERVNARRQEWYDCRPGQADDRAPMGLSPPIDRDDIASAAVTGAQGDTAALGMDIIPRSGGQRGGVTDADNSAADEERAQEGQAPHGSDHDEPSPNETDGQGGPDVPTLNGREAAPQFPPAVQSRPAPSRYEHTASIGIDSNVHHLPFRGPPQGPHWQQEWTQPIRMQPPPPGQPFMQHPPMRRIPSPPPAGFRDPAPTFDDFDEGELSWDSELDAPPDSDDERMMPTYPKPPAPPPPPEDEEEFAGEPWNAVCVVGLRVYAKIDHEVRVDIVRPDLGGQLCSVDTREKEGLDLDDPMADQAEQNAME